MAKKPSFNFSEQYFIDKGYTKGLNGEWNPPALKSNFVRGLKGQPPIKELVVKQKVNNTTQFEVKPVIEWFIPYQTPSKKNSRINMMKGGKIISIPSNKYREYITATKMYWQTFGKEFNSTIAKLDLKFPLDIEMTFIRKTNQLVDYFGPAESVFDLMTDFGWWKDDNRFYGKPFFGDMEVDKNNPGVKIKILLSK